MAKEIQPQNKLGNFLNNVLYLVTPITAAVAGYFVGNYRGYNQAVEDYKRLQSHQSTQITKCLEAIKNYKTNREKQRIITSQNLRDILKSESLEELDEITKRLGVEEQ